MKALLDRVFEGKVIVNCDRQPYLHRWYVLRTEAVGIFIHKFVRSDEDRALHDHPWSFIVIPLWGGYIEHSDRQLTFTEWWDRAVLWSYSNGKVSEAPRLTDRITVKRRVWPIISSRYRATDFRHRVELIDERPSWSLFFRFKKVREWGFWPTGGFVQWNKWWQDKCE